jgi:hypothetical protein
VEVPLFQTTKQPGSVKELFLRSLAKRELEGGAVSVSMREIEFVINQKIASNKRENLSLVDFKCKSLNIIHCVL